MYYIVHYTLKATESFLKVAIVNPSPLTCRFQCFIIYSQAPFPFFISLFSGVYSKHAAS
jgi:hypothetical protein